jgi:hypothetical protein
MARTQRATGDEEGLPKYFAKSGHWNTDPTKVKKNGHGRGNWGREGEELEDLQGEFNFHHTRRRSNSMTGNHPDINSTTKFDANDDVFDEEEH